MQKKTGFVHGFSYISGIDEFQREGKHTFNSIDTK